MGAFVKECGEVEFSRLRSNLRRAIAAVTNDIINLKNDLTDVNHFGKKSYSQFSERVENLEKNSVSIDKYNLIRIRIGDIMESLKEVRRIDQKLIDFISEVNLYNKTLNNNFNLQIRLIREDITKFTGEVSSEFSKVYHELARLEAMRDAKVRLMINEYKKDHDQKYINMKQENDYVFNNLYGGIQRINKEQNKLVSKYTGTLKVARQNKEALNRFKSETGIKIAQVDNNVAALQNSQDSLVARMVSKKHINDELLKLKDSLAKLSDKKIELIEKKINEVDKRAQKEEKPTKYYDARDDISQIKKELKDIASLKGQLAGMEKRFGSLDKPVSNDKDIDKLEKKYDKEIESIKKSFEKDMEKINKNLEKVQDNVDEYDVVDVKIIDELKDEIKKIKKENKDIVSTKYFDQHYDRLVSDIDHINSAIGDEFVGKSEFAFLLKKVENLEKHLKSGSEKVKKFSSVKNPKLEKRFIELTEKTEKRRSKRLALSKTYILGNSFIVIAFILLLSFVFFIIIKMMQAYRMWFFYGAIVLFVIGFALRLLNIIFVQEHE